MRTVAEPTDTEPTPETLSFKITNIASDAAQILQFLSDKAKEYGKNTTVRDFAMSMFPSSMTNNDQELQLETILDFVLNNLIYVKDPNGVEYVISPIQMIRSICSSGSATGDCDDHALFFNSLLNSVGFQTRFIGVKINGSQDFNHVISSANLNGIWIDIDTTMKAAPTIQYSGDKLVVLS